MNKLTIDLIDRINQIAESQEHVFIDAEDILI